jgi:hypothetical protein
MHRVLKEYDIAREFLEEAWSTCQNGLPDLGKPQVNLWIPGLTQFELAVLELKQTEDMTKSEEMSGTGTPSSEQSLAIDVPPASPAANGAPGTSMFTTWGLILDSATAHLDQAMSVTPNSVDLSSRFDSRVALLRGEIALKKEMLGIS